MRDKRATEPAANVRVDQLHQLAGAIAWHALLRNELELCLGLPQNSVEGRTRNAEVMQRIELGDFAEAVSEAEQEIGPQQNVIAQVRDQGVLESRCASRFGQIVNFDVLCVCHRLFAQRIVEQLFCWNRCGAPALGSIHEVVREG
jgi:hypothetical protein